MTSKSLIAAILTALIFASCGSKKAFNYSEMVVSKEKSLAPALIETEEKATKYVSAGQLDSVVIVSEKMEQKFDDVIKDIKNEAAPSVPEGENFKSASIRYFEYLKSIYTSYKAYGQAATDEAREEERVKMVKIVDKKQEAINDMQDAQRKYAKANGFKLEGQ